MRPPITWRDMAAGALAGLALCALMSVALQPEPVSALGYVMSAISGGAFALARRYPLATLGITTYAIVFYTTADEPGGPIYVAVFAAAMNLAARTEHTRGWLPWVGASGFLLLIAEAVAGEFQWHFLPVVALLVVLPKIVADRSRARHLHMSTLEARVEATEHEAHRRMAEERLRIAREVHDVVGHGLAAISLRAGVADHVRDRDPEQVAEALAAIRKTSKQSLKELSALLDALRDGAPAEHAPAPGLRHVPRLVDTLCDAGLPVTLERETGGVNPPEIVGAAGYRIVQEALTNVVRHAGAGASARVVLMQRNGALEVEVSDDGHGAGSFIAPRGGITGMRERTQALGGRFDAGTAPGGGFRVRASLPVSPR